MTIDKNCPVHGSADPQFASRKNNASASSSIVSKLAFWNYIPELLPPLPPMETIPTISNKNQLNDNSISSRAANNNTSSATAAKSLLNQTECPIAHKPSNKNLDSDMAINPLNRMPDLPQTKRPGQAETLPTDRVISSIPRGHVLNSSEMASACPTHQQNLNNNNLQSPGQYGQSAVSGDTHWVYPSEQQFYNALHRKGYATDEKDISVLVAIHNELNERSWDEVREWERWATG